MISRMGRMKTVPAVKLANPVNPVHPVKNPCSIRGYNSPPESLLRPFHGTELA